MRFINTNIAFLALCVLFSGCKQQAAPQPAGDAPPAAATVKLIHPEKTDVRRFIERPGYNIEAFERTPIYAKIAGYVRKWNKDIGDSVQKDDILAEIYIPEMDVELEQKKAAVERAQAEIKQAEAALLRARAELSRTKKQYERLANLTSVLDKEQVDEYRLGFEAAQAAMAKADADVEVTRARLKVAEADRDQVQTLLQYTKIRAPYNGVVTRRTINTGDFVQPAAASKGESLFVVEQIKPVRVFANIQETEAVWVRDADAALIRTQSLQGEQFKGTVTRRSRSLYPQNRTLRTEIDLPNEDGKLLPGMFVNVTIIARHADAWTLPATAVVTQAEESYGYRVEAGKAVRTPLRIAMRGNDPDRKVQLVEVLKKRAGKEGEWSDVTKDDRFIENAADISDGQAVAGAGE
jgi:RND family efflux transporter MFP subunit